MNLNFKFFLVLLMITSACCGAENASSSGINGKNWDASLSLSAIDNGFPKSFNKKELTIKEAYANKFYHRAHSESIANSFQSSLLNKSFSNDTADLVCGGNFHPYNISYVNLYKRNAKRSMLGCVSIGHGSGKYYVYTNRFTYFDTYLTSVDGSDEPSDSDLYSVFGQISGVQETASRTIVAVDNANARNVINSYKTALVKANFVCPPSSKEYDLCQKALLGLSTLSFFVGYKEDTLEITFSLQRAYF
ncbi:MAG: hypothetical protein LBT96_05070 [Campylobacteraceae bacterium]|jgi:hypothetical protein|nr:hypothetical protein [Campylobacteraceae bacterium]